MKLISCYECGIVLDQDKVIPSDQEEYEEKFYDEEFNPKLGSSIWNGDWYYAAIECPVCKFVVKTDIRL